MFHNIKVLQAIEVLVSSSRSARAVRSIRRPRSAQQPTTLHSNEENTSEGIFSKDTSFTAKQTDRWSETKLSAATNPIMQNTATNSVVRNISPSEMIDFESTTKSIITEDSKHEKLADAVTPLWRLRYAVQLQLKQNRAAEVLRALKKKLVENGIEKFPVQQLSTPCPLQDIIPSPVVHAYRNKDQFVVQQGVDGDPKTVGFLTGHPLDPITKCVPPTHLLNIKPQHKAVCHHFEEFIRQNKHPACIHFRDSPGVWRAVTVRSSRAGHLMAIVIIHPHTLTQEELAELKGELTSYFSSGPGAAARLTSLYLQVCPHTQCSREQAPYELLLGQPYITETCGGISFQLSPDTFFQVNVEAGELLYNAIKETAELSSYSTLLDVCCGTGAIGLPLAGSVRGVVGVEAVTAAVEDANYNALHNGITNASFVPGPVQKVLPLLTPELRDCADVVAVVNPGRGGLSSGVITSLRENPAVSKLLYISCNAEGKAFDNFVRLGSLKSKHLRNTPPMLPRYAFAVDMFPLTNHFEMGILFLKPS